MNRGINYQAVIERVYQQIATQAMRQRSIQAVRESVTLEDKVVSEEEFAEIAESLNK